MTFKPTTYLLLILLAGCAGTSTHEPVPDPYQDLTLLSAFPLELDLADQATLQPSVHALAEITVAVTGTIEPAHAPLPANTAEQLVFSNCYDTLTRVDLAGRVRPQLARNWESFDHHRRWTLTLAPGARFWDGTPLTAQAVLASWLATNYRTTSTPSAPNPLRWLQPETGRITTPDAHTIVVNLAEPMPDLPAQLAHPALAVRGVVQAGSDWPLGTGTCRPVAKTGDLALVPAQPHTTTWDTLRVVQELKPGQAHDLILATTNIQPADMITTILPWQTMYVLVCPPESLGTTENDRRRWTTELALNTWAQDLAPGRSRALADWPFIQDRERLCPYLRLAIPSWLWPDFTWPGRHAARDKDLVLYPGDDPIAKGLAEILAEHAGRPLRPAEALVGRGPLTAPRRPSGGLAPQAIGPSRSDFEAALQAGRAGAYILPVTREAGSGCRQLAGILGRALWLQDAADNRMIAEQPLPQSARALHPLAYADPTEAEQAALRLERSRVLTPLIVTRPALWSRPGLRGIGLDFQGNIDLTQIGQR